MDSNQTELRNLLLRIEELKGNMDIEDYQRIHSDITTNSRVNDFNNILEENGLPERFRIGNSKLMKYLYYNSKECDLDTLNIIADRGRNLTLLDFVRRIVIELGSEYIIKNIKFKIDEEMKALLALDIVLESRFCKFTLSFQYIESEWYLCGTSKMGIIRNGTYREITNDDNHDERDSLYFTLMLDSTSKFNLEDSKLLFILTNSLKYASEEYKLRLRYTLGLVDEINLIKLRERFM